MNAGPVANSQDDRTLVDRCKRGEPFAWTALIQRYQDRLYNVCWRVVGDADEAADLTQEVFVSAVENIGKFEQRSGLYTWLYRIAVNLSLTRRRSRGRRRMASLDAPPAPQAGDERRGPGGLEPESREFGPATAVDRTEQAAAVARALDGLSDEYRTILVLRDVEDLDYAEIGEILELPAGTVKSRLFRARLALKEALGADFEG